ncbi:uncharacterized protein [Miscanthus floridulus]|uniref:uncharacterized protein n=1 Tax=Miscanthus floridulus TaxID=154761 RepID=UPI003457D876
MADFFSFAGAAASLLARLPKPAQCASEPRPAVCLPTSHAGLLTPSRAALASAQPVPFPCSARGAHHAPTRGRELLPCGVHVSRCPPRGSARPDPAPTRPPTPAGARAPRSRPRPRCLPSPPELRAPSSGLAAHRSSPTANSAPPCHSLIPPTTRNLRLALLQDFSPSRAAALASGPPAEAGPVRQRTRPRVSTHLARRPAHAIPRAALASAQPRAVPLLAVRPRADRGRELPPRGDHVPVSPTARQPRLDPAPRACPTPASARCPCSLPPRAAFLLLRAESPKLCTRRARSSPASNSCTTAPSSIPPARNSASHSFKSRLELRRLRAQVELPRASPTDGHCAVVLGPPWKSSFFSSSLASLPYTHRFSSHIPCALPALTAMAGDGRGLVDEPRRRANAHTGEASASASQPG